MARVIFVDTSVLLNLLDVPNRNADREAVGAEYRRRISEGQLILPLSTVIETGNHIAHVADGGARRTCAETFVEMLRMIVADKTPFVLHEMGWDADFLSRLIGGGSTAVSFVDHLTQRAHRLRGPVDHRRTRPLPRPGGQGHHRRHLDAGRRPARLHVAAAFATATRLPEDPSPAGIESPGDRGACPGPRTVASRRGAR